MDLKIGKEEFEEIIKQSYCYADVCRLLGIKPHGKNYNTVKRYIKEYNLDISHFTLQRTNIGNRLNKHNEKPLEEIFVKNSNYDIKYLKRRLFRSGFKEYKCEICGLSYWNEKPIVLQLHHINGDNTDNRLENIQILCPNCHSQTDNYCGTKNKKSNTKFFCDNCGKEIEKNGVGLCNDCYQLLIENKLDRSCLYKDKKIQVVGYCKNCNKELHEHHEHGLCKECNSIRKLSEKIDIEEFSKLIYEKSFRELGKIYNVSDKAISKWCKKLNLPYRKKDMK